MDHAIEFIETHLFTKQIKTIATDDELRQLQYELISQPKKGDLIQDHRRPPQSKNGHRKSRQKQQHKELYTSWQRKKLST